MKTTLNLFAALLILIFVLPSCENDSDDDVTKTAKGEIVIANVLPNPDGMSGSAYLQLIGDLTPKNYDNKTSLPFTLFDQFIIKGNDLYVLPYNNSDVVKKFTRGENKQFMQAGELTVDANSSPSGLAIKNSTKGYISLQGRAKIIIFNPMGLNCPGQGFEKVSCDLGNL